MTKFAIGLFLLVAASASSQGSESASLVLTLDRAVELAITNSYQLKNDDFDVRLAESALRLAKDRFRPKLTTGIDNWYTLQTKEPESDDSETVTNEIGLRLGTDFIGTGGTAEIFTDLSRTDSTGAPIYTLDGWETGELYSNSYGIRYTQPLLRNGWSKVAAAPVKQSTSELQSASLSYILAEQRTINSVINAYFSALKAAKLVAVYESALNEANEHYELANTKLREGMVAPLQVAQSELQAARQRNSLIAAQRNADEALERLKLLVSLDLSAPVELSLAIEKRLDEVDESSLIAEALSGRVEIKQILSAIESAEQESIISANSRLPDLHLALEASLTDSDEELGDALQGADRDYGVGLGFNYVFGAGLNKEAYYQSSLCRRKLENDFLQLKQTITQEVKSAVRTYSALRESLAVSQKAVDLAAEGLELAKKSYSEGLISNLDLLKAQDEVLNANTMYFSDLTDLQTAVANILLAIGRRLDPHHLSLSLVSSTSSTP